MPIGIAGPVTAGAIQTLFVQALKRAVDSIMGKTCGTRPMKAWKAKLGGVGSITPFSEHTGEAKITDLARYEIDMLVKRYQSGFEYDETTPADEIWAEVSPKIEELAAGAANHALQLLASTTIANPTCYDGTALYNTVHPYKGGTQSNYLTGTGTTIAQVKTDYRSAVAALRGFKTTEGDPYYHSTFNLQVRAPIALEGIFDELLGSEIISSSSNTLKGKFELWIDPGFTDANDWYLDVISDVAKPLIYGLKQAPKVKQYQKDPGNYKIQVSADVIHGFSPGEYRKTVQVHNT